ncbi:hypothetical protein [Stakelama pacifica]|uniref:hypothetical protein n=1 Tax=Stakelama pacifica TaxID=517720 RepID=UPI0010600C69|nr:hypothetical protein [Stakelama pacifica]
MFADLTKFIDAAGYEVFSLLRIGRGRAEASDRLGKVDLGLSALHFAHIIEREGEQRFLAIRIIASRFVQMLQNGGCTDALQVVTKRGRR